MIKREIKHKNIFLVYLFAIITFGIYGIVWTVKSKRDMNSLGASIPTTWLAIIPFVNFYWVYKYCEGFAHNIKKDDNTALWFCLYIFVGFLNPIFVQGELNKIAAHSPIEHVSKKQAA